MYVLIILRRKCTLAASRAASHVEYAPRAILRLRKDGTDGRTDGQAAILCLLLDRASIIKTK